MRLRVVEAEHFQEAAVTRRAAVRGDDAVEGAVAAAVPRQPYSHDHRRAAEADAQIAGAPSAELPALQLALGAM
jgi:hypothetical protein